MFLSSQTHKGETSEASVDRARVVVRFREGVRLPERENLEAQIEELAIGPWKQLMRESPERLSPVFTYLKLDQMCELIQRAMEMDPTCRPADFETIFYVEAPAGTDPVALVKAFLSWNSIRQAYIDQAGPDPVVNAAATTPARPTKAIWTWRPAVSTPNMPGLSLAAMTLGSGSSIWNAVGP